VINHDNQIILCVVIDVAMFQLVQRVVPFVKHHNGFW
jgi:hypothetical protein